MLPSTACFKVGEETTNGWPAAECEIFWKVADTLLEVMSSLRRVSFVLWQEYPYIYLSASRCSDVSLWLVGLADSGFTDMVRVGSVKRIAKPILRFALHSSDGHRGAQEELKDMLKEAASPGDAAIIR